VQKSGKSEKKTLNQWQPHSEPIIPGCKWKESDAKPKGAGSPVSLAGCIMGESETLVLFILNEILKQSFSFINNWTENRIF
jgi:hypothetical protein